MSDTKTDLKTAAQAFGCCAAKAKRKEPPAPSKDNVEMLIAMGSCCDWLHWAASLRDIDFKTALKRNGPRRQSFLESTRFQYAWTGANALFSRDVVLSRLSKNKPPSKELARFRVLAKAAALSDADKASLVGPLHKTLALPRSPNRFPWQPKGSTRVIDVIHYKYMPDRYKNFGEVEKAVKKVVDGEIQVADLDLPTLIYCTRNWITHGVFVNTGLRGAPQTFPYYVSSTTQALARILQGTAAALKAKL